MKAKKLLYQKVEKNKKKWYNTNMKQISVGCIILFLIGLICATNKIYTNVPFSNDILSGIKEVEITQDKEALDSKSLIFYDEEKVSSLNYISFDKGKILLTIDYNLFSSTLNDLSLKKKKIIIFATKDEKEKTNKFVENCKKKGVAVNVSIQDNSILFIKNFKNIGQNYDVIIIFQDSPLFSKNNQKMIITLILTMKKIIISFGISEKAPGVLSFTPKNKSLIDGMNKFYANNKLNQTLKLNQVNFNLRYAALIGLKFPTKFLSKVKKIT